MKDENLKFENISGEFIFKNTRVAIKPITFVVTMFDGNAGFGFIIWSASATIIR